MAKVPDKALALASKAVVDKEAPRYVELFTLLTNQAIEQTETYYLKAGIPWKGGCSLTWLHDQAVKLGWPVLAGEEFVQFVLCLGFNIRVEGGTRPKHFVIHPAKGQPGGETILPPKVTAPAKDRFTKAKGKGKAAPTPPKGQPTPKAPAKAPSKGKEPPKTGKKPPVATPPAPPAPKAKMSRSGKPNGDGKGKAAPVPVQPKPAAQVKAEINDLYKKLWLNVGTHGQMTLAKEIKPDTVLTKDIIFALAEMYVAGETGNRPRRRPETEVERAMLSAGEQDARVKREAQARAKKAMSQISAHEGERPGPARKAAPLHKAAPKPAGRKRVVRRK